MLDLITDNPDSLAWQQARTAEALSAIQAFKGYDKLRRQVFGYGDASARWIPVRAGDRWFQQRRVGDAELPQVTVRDAIDDEPRVLVDFNDFLFQGGRRMSSAWVCPSPDGSVLAYSLTAEGTEVNEVHLVDVVTGRELPDVVPWNVAFAPSWLPDGSGFWCATREITATGVTMSVRRFLLGEPTTEWVAPLPTTLAFPRPEVSKDGHYVAIATGNTEMRIDCLITKDLQVVPFLTGVPGSFRGTIRDDALWALTDNGAPRGRVVRIPLDSSTDIGSWTEVLPESDDTVVDVDVMDDKLVVASLRECSVAIDVLDLPSGQRTVVPLPGKGAAGVQIARVAYPMLPVFERGTGEITFLYSDLTSSPAVYRYVLDEQRLECLDPPAITLDGMTVSYITATSADGNAVPAHVLHRADLDLSRPHPTFLWGYGGFHLSELPSYPNGHAAWVVAGGIYVLAHLRGGSEFGADWWRQGRREHKQNTFNDFYAVAEKLIDLGWTSSDKLAIYGGSNGGLLTAVALTQRPELWAAVVSDVPAVDLLHMEREPLMYAICKDEYGDPLVETERPWLAAIDPLTNAPRTAYPATLVVAGANDPRCPANQARLLADRIATQRTGASPVLLRIHEDQGHGGQGAHAAADRLTEILAFCAYHTGLSVGR